MGLVTHELHQALSQYTVKPFAQNLHFFSRVEFLLLLFRNSVEIKMFSRYILHVVLMPCYAPETDFTPFFEAKLLLLYCFVTL